MDESRVARLVQRLAVEQGRWAPLVQVPTAQLGSPNDLADALAVARGGWLHTDAEVDRATADRAAVRLMLPDRKEALRASPAALAAIHRWDPHHPIAADPALGRLRDAVLAHAARDDVMLVTGPPGAGRRALVLWAHSLVGDGPITVIGRDGTRAGSDNAWLLVEDLDVVERTRLGPLLARLIPPAAGPPVAASVRRP
ncbi:MAG: hypothetical protein ABMB14_28075, partial [Myxococcota bacterium]